MGKTKSRDRKTARHLLAVNTRMQRAKVGMTREQLSNIAGVDRGYIGQIETEGRAVSVDIIDRLAIALNVPVAQLFIEQDSGE